MSQNKRKKLSLDEARVLFADPADKRKPQRNNSRSPRSSRPSRSPRSSQSYPPRDQAQIKKRISMLERRVMEGSLSNEEEEQVLKQIDQLEKQIK